MSVTDQALLTALQFALIEDPDSGATWTSGLWTPAEVLDYLNQRQNRLLRESMILLSEANITVNPATLRQDLPFDWIATQRVVWRKSDGTRRELPRSDSFETDAMLPSWPYTLADRPQVYMDAETPTLQIQIAPAPLDVGRLEILYVALGALLTGLGEIFTVPDEFVPAIKYGVLADMLSKIGRASDQTRIQYCESRFQEGIEAGKLMLMGWA